MEDESNPVSEGVSEDALMAMEQRIVEKLTERFSEAVAAAGAGGGSERPADESNEGETPLTWGECLGYLQQAFRISMGYHSSQESR